MEKKLDNRRRELLGGAGALVALLVAQGLLPSNALAAEWNQNAFSGKTMQEVLKALGATPTPTKDVTWGSTPEIAENGAVVPIAVTSGVPKTDAIVIIIEKNPNPLAAAFEIPAGTDPSITTRVKMGQSSDVHALIHADGKYFVATREIKVTLGGCGG